MFKIIYRISMTMMRLNKLFEPLLKETLAMKFIAKWLMILNKLLNSKRLKSPRKRRKRSKIQLEQLQPQIWPLQPQNPSLNPRRKISSFIKCILIIVPKALQYTITGIIWLNIDFGLPLFACRSGLRSQCLCHLELRQIGKF